MTTQTIRLVNGGTVQIREGILRGVGPAGPPGDVGPAGAATTIRGTVVDAGALPSVGSQGDAFVAADTGNLWVWQDDLIPRRWEDAGRIVGPSGDLQSPSAQASGVGVGSVPGTTWQTLAFDSFDYNDTQSIDGTDYDVASLVTGNSAIQVNHPSGEFGSYSFDGYVELTTPAGASEGWRQLGLFAGSNMVASSTLYDPGIDNTPLFLSVHADQRTNDTTQWSLRLLANDAAGITVNYVRLTVSRLGGGIGLQGPQGPQGDQGPQGIQGPVGAAQDGFASYTEITGGGRDAADDPGGTSGVTLEQAFPIPAASQRPHTPFFLKRLAETLERYVVARFNTLAEVGARAGTEPGELTYVKSPSSPSERGLYLKHDDTAPTRVPLVRYGTTPPPATTDDPDGTIFLVYVS
jgi:hypothetical protein